MGTFGANYGASYDLTGIPAPPADPHSISHITLDAGEDLRRRPKERLKQILKLSIEIRMTGTVMRTETSSVKMAGIAKHSITNKPGIKGTIRTPLKTKLNIRGSASVRQSMTADMAGQKSFDLQILRGLRQVRETNARIAKIGMLKDMLRELDEE